MGFNWSKIINNYWTTVFIPSYFRYNYYKLFDKSKTFKFQGQELSIF